MGEHIFVTVAIIIFAVLVGWFALATLREIARQSKKEESWTQIVYDADYEETCPVCYTIVKENRHSCKEENSLEKKTLMECPSCHTALYGRQVKWTKTLKTYIRDESAPVGLRMVKEEIIEEIK